MAGSSELRAAEAEYVKTALGHTKMKMVPWPWYAVAVLFYVVDRLLKHLALSNFEAGVGRPAAFTLFMNTGIAFSLQVPDAVFWPAAALALAVILWSFGRTFRREPVTAAALFFVLCGAISNLMDRLRYDATVDYLLFFDRSAVNVADGLIVGGLLALLLKQRSAHEKRNAEH